MNCTCHMFQEKGICYHTGYKPSFAVSDHGTILQQAMNGVKRAFSRYREEGKPTQLLATPKERKERAEELRRIADKLEENKK